MKPNNKKDVNILLKYINNRHHIYSLINVFDYICEGDTAIITKQLETHIHSILILRKNLDFLEKHTYINKKKVEEEIKYNGYYIQEIQFSYAKLEDQSPDIVTNEKDELILKYLDKKPIPFIKTFRYIPRQEIK